MNPVYSLEKIADIRESEFNDAHAKYNLAIDHFKQVGQQLYDLLKNKEELEERLEQKTKERIKAFKLSQYLKQLELLKEEEKKIQVQVHQARVNMQSKEQQLAIAHQELKKLEKIIDRRKEEQKKSNQKIENNFLDELSIQQYMKANG